MIGFNCQNHRSTHRIRSSESGASMIGLLIGFGVSMVVVTIASKFMLDSMRDQKKLEVIIEFDSIRREMMSMIDCAATMADTQCNGSSFQYVAITKKGAGGTMIPQVGKTIGKFFVRAQCKTDATSNEKVLQVLTSTTNPSLPKTLTDYVTDVGCGIPTVPVTTNLCEDLGGVWDTAGSYCKMRSAGIYILSMREPGIDRDRVLQCDVRISGSGADLKTCNRIDAPGEAGTCVFTAGNGDPSPPPNTGYGGSRRWIYKYNGGGSYRECEGGIYVNMAP